MKKSGMVALVLVFAMVATVASASMIVPFWVSVKSVDAGLSIKGSTASCSGEILAMKSDAACSVTVSLQKKDGTKWTTVKSWSGSGKGSAIAGGTYAVASGTYRVYTSGKAAGESATCTSSSKTK